MAWLPRGLIALHYPWNKGGKDKLDLCINSAAATVKLGCKTACSLCRHLRTSHLAKGGKCD